MNNKLVNKYFSNSKLNDKELQELFVWLSEKENRKIFDEYARVHFLLDYAAKDFDEINSKEKILQDVVTVKKKSRVYLFRQIYKYAALLVVALLIGYFALRDSTTYIKNKPTSLNAISPATPKAILTLENGSTVLIQKDSMYNFTSSTSNGKELEYKPTHESNKNSEVAYNYLTVPRGGQFFVKLSDGTQVWLNSDSQLRYPVHFIKGEPRKVQLVYGEAYFDVSHSTNHDGSSFILEHKNQSIEVLGTEFNVRAYKDDIKAYTTLIEGKIAVKDKNTDSLFELAPNDQAIFDFDLQELNVNKIDPYTEVAWKKGLFAFQKSSLKEITKILSRWYDVPFAFEDNAKENIHFTGILRRDKNISSILDIIEETKEIKFVKKGNIIYIK